MIRGSLLPVSSRSTLILTFPIFDQARDEPIDLTGSDITIEITPRGQYCCSDYEFPGDCPPRLKADLTSGVAYLDKGYVQLVLPPERHGLRPGTYTVRLFVSAHGFVSELLNATLPVEV